MEKYKTILKENMDEIIIERSKFLGYAAPVETEGEAIDFIKGVNEKHKDANHNVYGYTIGYDNEVQRYSDDGEPSGTAGIPVLEVIRKEDLKNVVVVVTRYFGGIKLGAGGLVRAYTKAAKLGLAASKIVSKRLYSQITLKIDYSLIGKIQNEIIQQGYYIKDTVYQEDVAFNLYVRNTEVEGFKAAAIDWTNDKAIIIEGETEYLTEIEGKILK
ncbi:YigZ family protein [Alkaliphilus pronyensis]|uniref:YigZ family protein n=1 Tax=Alkaliphilus pronyensis TaxID=1482732 RepID=UPI00242F6D33|nr:YigZ family protein [Alkaliphilus pronyensis]